MLKYSIFPQLTCYISFYADCPCSLPNVTICLFLTEAALAFCPHVLSQAPYLTRSPPALSLHSIHLETVLRPGYGLLT